MAQKLRKQQVAERYQHNARTIERWMKDPSLGFPQPIFIGRAPLWDAEELDAFDRSRTSSQNSRRGAHDDADDHRSRRRSYAV